MKRLLIITLLAPILATAMELAPQQRNYNAPSLKLLAARKVGQVNTQAKIEKMPMAKELKDYTFLLENYAGPLTAQRVNNLLVDASMTSQLDETLLNDLYALNPNLDLNHSCRRETALTWATSHGNCSLMEFLIDHGAGVNHTPDYNPENPVFLIANSRSALKDSHLNALTLLCKRGAQINAINQTGETPLICLAKYECSTTEEEAKHTAAAKFLLENGADINAQDDHNRTALIKAVKNNFSLLRLLLQHNPQLELTTLGDDTAFSLACIYKNLEAMRLLRQAGANINHQQEQYPNCTPLMTAVVQNNEAVARLLLEFGVNTQIATLGGDTALHIAVAQDATDSANMTALLITHGADINAPNVCRVTPLIKAIQRNNTTAIKQLYLAGCHVPQDLGQRLEFHIKELIRHNNQEFIKLLLDIGAIDLARDAWIMDYAQGGMKEFLQNHRKPEYQQLPWYRRMQFEAQQVLNNHPDAARRISAGIAGAAAGTAWYLLKRK